MKYALLELPDNFKKGCCQDCPFSYTEWFDDDGYTDCQDVCVFNSRYDECPLDIKTERVPFDFDLFEAGLMYLPKDTVDVLDKIRAEIEEVELNITYKENYKVGGTWGLRKALEIIDKYKAESEG